MKFQTLPSHSKRKPARILSQKDESNIRGDLFLRKMDAKDICDKWQISSHRLFRICGCTKLV